MISPCGWACKKNRCEFFFSKMFYSAKNESFSPLPIFIPCRTHSSPAQKRKNVSGLSESSITSPESSRLWSKTLLGPWLKSICYSSSQNIVSSNPPTSGRLTLLPLTTETSVRPIHNTRE